MNLTQRRIIPIKLTYNDMKAEDLSNDTYNTRIMNKVKERRLKDNKNQLIFPNYTGEEQNMLMYYNRVWNSAYLITNSEMYYNNETYQMLKLLQQKSNYVYDFHDLEGISYEIETKYFFARSGKNILNSRTYKTNMVSDIKQIKKLNDRKSLFSFFRLKDKIKNYCFHSSDSNVYSDNNVIFHPLFLFYVEMTADGINYYEILNKQYLNIITQIEKEESIINNADELIHVEKIDTSNFIYWENAVAIQDFQKIVSFITDSHAVLYQLPQAVQKNIYRLIDDFFDYYFKTDKKNQDSLIYSFMKILKNRGGELSRLKDDLIDMLIKYNQKEILTFIMEEESICCDEKTIEISIFLEKDTLHNVLSEDNLNSVSSVNIKRARL